MDIASIVARVAMISIQAGRVADDLDEIMKADLTLNHAQRGKLHRLSVVARELSLHSDHALRRTKIASTM